MYPNGDYHHGGRSMADAKIQVLKNGPLLVQGPVDLTDGDGNPIEAKSQFALCRCGASAKKPFCDGTHSKIGFDETKSESKEE
jgi:CDGSH-type Zn-finger protein